MLVRPATATDFDAIASLTNLYIRTTAVHFGYEQVTPDELRAMWAAKRDVYPWLVAEVEGRFAGYAKASAWRARDAYNWTAETTVYVEQEFQRRGAGRALYERLIDVLRQQGFESAVGGITLPNDGSVRLHESMGFVHVGTVRRAGWKLGRWHDVGFWQLMLGDGGQATPIRPAASQP